MELKSSFLQELSWRGYIKDCTNFQVLDDWFQSENRHFYIGFDCTAQSLHVGSLMQIMIMRIGQKHGHKPILLFGGGTTKVGDPSGKDKTRQILNEEQIQKNIDGISKTVAQFLNFDKITFVNNDEWLSSLKYIEFLREFGAKFSINRMLGFESVKSRISREQELTFLEFNYMIMQAYDFLILNRKFDCRVQFGGSDQWGNIVNGVELARKVDSVELFGLTTQLLTTSDGKKMGKTADGAVWLSSEFLSSQDYWQFFRNVKDKDVFKFLALLTDLSQNEIEALKINEKTSKINDMKKILANEVTKICHGKNAAREAEEVAQKVFEQGESHDEMPKIVCKNEKMKLIDLIVESGVVASKSEMKKLIAVGAIMLNDEKITEIKHEIEQKNIPMKISIGKKRKFLIIN